MIFFSSHFVLFSSFTVLYLLMVCFVKLYVNLNKMVVWGMATNGDYIRLWIWFFVGFIESLMAWDCLSIVFESNCYLDFTIKSFTLSPGISFNHVLQIVGPTKNLLDHNKN